MLAAWTDPTQLEQQFRGSRLRHPCRVNTRRLPASTRASSGQFGAPQGQYGAPQGQYDPPPGQYGPPPGAFPPPPPGRDYDPVAPYGRHPLTGEPFSDKSKVVAGLLQLLGLLGWSASGASTSATPKLGIIQLVVGIVTCGIGAVIWGIIDAIIILTDKVRDPQGRPLRDGTYAASERTHSAATARWAPAR